MSTALPGVDRCPDFPNGWTRDCAAGSGFTPGGAVTVKYIDRPTSAYPNESAEFSVGNADAEGKIAFDDSSQLDQFIGSCTQDQSFHDVVAVVTDVASGDTITRNLPSCMWCLQSLCPTSVGGGCPMQ